MTQLTIKDNNLASPQDKAGFFDKKHNIFEEDKEEISICSSCNCITRDMIPVDKENPILCGKCGEDKEG